jgi:predicted ATPase
MNARRDRFRWFAVTGGPSCGKTTVVEALGEAGFTVVGEAAREVFEEHRARVGDAYRIRDDERAFHDEVAERNVAAMHAADPDRVTFFDRTVVDSAAYAVHHGWPAPPGIGELELTRFRRAFLLDPLPWAADGVRYEGRAFAQTIDPVIERAYGSAGIPVTRVPVTTAAARLELIVAFAGA